MTSICHDSLGWGKRAGHYALDVYCFVFVGHSRGGKRRSHAHFCFLQEWKQGNRNKALKEELTRVLIQVTK